MHEVGHEAFGCFLDGVLRHGLDALRGRDCSSLSGANFLLLVFDIHCSCSRFCLQVVAVWLGSFLGLGDKEEI